MHVQDNLEQVLSAGVRRRQHRRQPAAAAAAAPSGNDSAVLADLLVKATDKRSQDLDAGLLRRIKALCKKSEEHIRAVHEYLLHALEANHAQVRYHAMDICDQLFQRSHLFRHLTTQHLPEILEHAVGTKASRPLPGPPSVATRLHEKALESIDQWADKYGAYYQQLRMSMRYLRDVLQMRFPQLRARAAAAEAEARAREARAQVILRDKFASIIETYDETSRDVQSTLAQMSEAFELLMPKPDQAQRSKHGLTAPDEEDLEWEDVAAKDAADNEDADEEDAEGLSEYKDTDLPKDLLGSTLFVQNPDATVLETLKELNQLLGGSHMRTVNEWLRILTQVVTGEPGSDEDRARDQLLRRATELRGSITRAQDRYGAVTDAVRAAKDITLGMPSAQQQAEGPSAQTQQGPKEAMPPWLARQQPKLADLFGASSSDNEQAPEQAALPANGRADEVNPCTAPASSTQAIRKDTTANNASAESAQNGVSAAGSGLRVNTPQPQLPSSALSANKSGGLQTPAKAAGENPGQHRQRINYSAVAKQLKRHPSGSASLYTQTELLRSAPASRGSSGHVRAKADEAAVLHSGNAEDESETPKGPAPRDLWESADSDEEASRESLDDRSADDNSAQLRSSSAEGRGADRRRNRTREAVRADSTASREAKKPSIPKSLKQALAAQAPLVPSGPHLAYWDSKDQALVNARGMQVYNHWGPVDEHKTLPTERLNELFGSMASYYEPPSNQDLKTAVKRKANPEKPSFKDEPLEAQRLKRPKVPMTPILPPGTAQLGVRISGPSNFMSVPEVKSSAAASDFAAGPAAAEPGKASLSDQIDHSAQRAAFLWPSQASLNTFHKAEGEASESVSMPAGKAAAEQDIDVEELEWKPGEAAGSSAGNTLEAMPIPVDQRRGFTLPQSEARGARAQDPEKPSKGQRALDKAHNDAVLAEAATRDPILAHRWAAQQASKAEKTKKAQGAKKKLGVRASLAKKLLNKRAVMSAAHDMSKHEAEAHQDLNTNRWEEK